MKKILLFFAVSALIFVTGCFDAPKDPVMPTWDVELNVPLVGKKLDLVEIIDSSNNPNLTIDPTDSLYLLVVDDITAESPIQDTLKIPVALAPDTIKINGPAGSGEIRSATVFNPDPDYHLYSAEFKKGSFILNFINSSAGTVDFEMILPGFKDKTTNEILRISDNLSAGQTANVNIDLSKYNYEELTIFPGFNDVNNFNFQGAPGFMFVAIAEATGNVDLNFNSEVNSDEITLAKLSGSIKRTELEYFEETLETKLGDDIKDFDNKVQFKNVSITLGAETVGQMANIQIELDSTTIKGYKTVNGVDQLLSAVEFDGKDYFRDKIVAGEPWELVLDNTNTNITTFLTKLPDKIAVGNKFILDKSTDAPDSLQTISNQDSIKFKASIKAPVVLSLREATYSDTTEVDLTQDDRDQILQTVTANITFEILNSIALGISASAEFLDADYNYLFDLKLEDGSKNIAVPPAQVDAQGNPITPTDPVKIKIVLTQEDIEKFAEVQYVVSSFSIKSTGSTSDTYGPFVRVRAKDHISYKMYGGLNYQVDPEDEDENGN